MKTPKSIIIVLFVLLTAQIASAYYCPATGRWLSRDPIGEPGFETLRTANVLPQVGSSMPAPSRWISRDPIGKRKIESSGNNINAFAFVQNAPTTFIDPLGLEVTLQFDSTWFSTCDANQKQKIRDAYKAGIDALQKFEDSGQDKSLSIFYDCLLHDNKNCHVRCGGCGCRGYNLFVSTPGLNNTIDTIWLCNPAFSPKPGDFSLRTAVLVEVAKAKCSLTIKDEYRFAHFVEGL